MKTVYLAGLISTDFPDTFHWRERAHTLLHEHANVLSPLRGKENLFKDSKDGGVNSDHLTSDDVIIRDYWDVRKSDVVLCHLETFGSTRPMIGTPMELSWCWEHHIPVVAVCRPTNTLMRTHPFIVPSVSHYVEDVDDGIELLLSHYLK